MKNITKILLTIYLFVSVNICFGQEVLSLSKWRFGTALSGGYSFANKDLTNDLNNYASCIWEIDLYYNRIQTSFYSQANWSQKTTCLISACEQVTISLTEMSCNSHH